MTKYKDAILSWVIAIAAFCVTAAVVFRIIIPILMIRVLGLDFPPTNGIGRGIVWGISGIVVFTCYLLLNNTVTGKKL